MYTFRKYNSTPRKYSDYIYQHLLLQTDCIENFNDNKVDWCDRNSESILQDYYPFDDFSIIDKKYLPFLLDKEILPNTYNGGDILSFKKDIVNNVFFLKPSDKYIGGGNGIIISNNLDELLKKYNKKMVIQEEVTPWLIDGYKFDIRTYVLIVYNNDMVHVYVDIGVARFCKDEYKNGTTNWDSQITTTGDYELITSVSLLYMYKDQIFDIIYGSLLKNTNESLLNITNIDKCGYQYLGYDFMVDETGKVVLIEVNIQPSFEKIKYNSYTIKDFSKFVLRPVLRTNKGYKPYVSVNNIVTLSDLSLKYHLNDLYKITNNYDVMKYIGNLKIWSYEKTKRFIKYGNSEDYYYKGIVYDNICIGIIGVYKTKANEYYNLVIYIDPKYFGKGIAINALKLLFLTIQKHPIYADVLLSNRNSIGFFNKLKYKNKTIGKIQRYFIEF